MKRNDVKTLYTSYMYHNIHYLCIFELYVTCNNNHKINIYIFDIGKKFLIVK